MESSRFSWRQTGVGVGKLDQDLSLTSTCTISRVDERLLGLHVRSRGRRQQRGQLFDPTDPGQAVRSVVDVLARVRVRPTGTDRLPQDLRRDGHRRRERRPGLTGLLGSGYLPANTPSTSPTQERGYARGSRWRRSRAGPSGYDSCHIDRESDATQNMNQFFGRPNVTGDDGWYIDDIHIDSGVGDRLTLTVDGASISAFRVERARP